MPKQNVTQVTVSGLATNPNANGLPAGSCAVATNVVSRRPGVLTPCPSSSALTTVSTADYTSGKGLWSDADNGVIAVLPNKDDANFWTPGENETQTGALVEFTVNQEVDAVQNWILEELPVAYDRFSEPPGPIMRDIGFLPGLTHSSFSAFRTLVNEKWGQVVCSGGQPVRWAGLYPPFIWSPGVTTSSDYPVIEDGNSVLYRAHFLLESLDQERPYEVIGPVSDIVPAFAENTGYASIIYRPNENEPLAYTTADYRAYICVYRSTQAAVDTYQELPDDFRLVAKVELLEADIGNNVTINDYASDDARAYGQELYTNAQQQSAANNNWCPPSARDLAVFRDTTFYANRSSLPGLGLFVAGPTLFDNTATLFSAADRTIGIGVRSFTATATNGSDEIVFTDPADLVGVVPGQYIHFTETFPSFVSFVGTVVAVDTGTNTVTVSDVWTGDNGASVTGWTADSYQMTVYWADGTTDSIEAPIGGGGSIGDNFLPCMRIFGAPERYPLPAEGSTILFLFTYPPYKRMLYFELCLTNGQNYSPRYNGDYLTGTEPLRSLVDTRPNRLFFSKTGQPEAVPVTNYVDVGAGTILKMWPTQSALLCLCTDGLWRLTGDGTSWQVYQVDPTVTLLHPDCLNSLNNQIYGWVEDGLALIGEDGAKTISTDAVGPDIREWATQIKDWHAPYFWGPCIAGDRFWNEIWLNVYRAYAADGGGPDHVTTLVYNTDTKNFTRLQAPQFSSLLYSPNANRMISQVFIPGSPNNAIALMVQSDFYDPEGEGWLPATVWFNALQTEDKGKLKQWMDVNYFVANVQTTVTIGGDEWVSYLKALFDARNESTDPLVNTYDRNVQSMVALSRDIHFWVPRRSALSDQQQLGLKSFLRLGVEDDDQQGFNFELQGFAVRYRIASDTLKR